MINSVSGTLMNLWLEFNLLRLIELFNYQEILLPLEKFNFPRPVRSICGYC